MLHVWLNSTNTQTPFHAFQMNTEYITNLTQYNFSLPVVHSWCILLHRGSSAAGGFPRRSSSRAWLHGQCAVLWVFRGYFCLPHCCLVRIIIINFVFLVILLTILNMWSSVCNKFGFFLPSSCWGAAVIYVLFLALSGSFIGVNIWRKKKQAIAS